MTNDLGAFVPDTDVKIAGADAGPFKGKTFAAKDVFDIAGHLTGNGNPAWRDTHDTPTTTAPPVQRLLDAGADLVGKTICDELCYSLGGDNVHYGTPVNSAAPDRLPGGSSSGSASAVAGGAVDLALGTDCGGSVRGPASFCGLYGIRPTYGRVSDAGCTNLASSFDTVGWFTRDAALFRELGQVLLDTPAAPSEPTRLLVGEDFFDAMPEATAAVQLPLVMRIADALGLAPEPVTLAPDGLDERWTSFRVIQAHEIWRNHGEWYRATNPEMGDAIRGRMEAAAEIGDAEAAERSQHRERVVETMKGLLEGGAIALIPTADIPPLKSASPEELDAFRANTMRLTSTAGLAGLPQVHLPLANRDGVPVGVSLLGWRGADEMLLEAAARIGG